MTVCTKEPEAKRPFEMQAVFSPASPGPSAPTVLPTEIYEEIITVIYVDHLDASGRWRADLCRCALVSRLWRPWSQRCLYRVLEFTQQSEAESNRVEILLRVLRDNPHLGLYVRDLRFKAAPYPTELTFVASWPNYLRLWPVMTAGKLPNLRNLELTGPAWRRTFQPHTPYFASLTTFRAVTKLTLAMMGFTHSCFFRILSCLPSLEHLAIHKLSWDDLHRSFPPKSLLRPRPPLCALRMLDRSSLLLGFDGSYTADYARRLWQIIGSFRMSMKALHLDTFSLYELKGHSKVLTGAFRKICFPHLCSLTLGYDVVRQYGDPASVAGLLDLFQRLDMPGLVTLNLVVHLSPETLHELLQGGTDSATALTDPSSKLNAYAARFPFLQSMNVLYLVYTIPQEPQSDSLSEEISSGAALMSEAAPKDTISTYLSATAHQFTTSLLYRRGILTIRGADITWQREFTPPRLAVALWKYHTSIEAPWRLSLDKLEYDNDLADFLLRL